MNDQRHHGKLDLSTNTTKCGTGLWEQKVSGLAVIFQTASLVPTLKLMNLSASLPNWAAGTPESFRVNDNKKKKTLTVDWRARAVMFCFSRSFPSLGRNYRGKNTLLLFIALNQIMFVLLSLLLSASLFYSHIFVDFLPLYTPPALTLPLLPPLFICHAFSLRSKLHHSGTDSFFTPCSNTNSGIAFPFFGNWLKDSPVSLTAYQTGHRSSERPNCVPWICRQAAGD